MRVPPRKILVGLAVLAMFGAAIELAVRSGGERGPAPESKDAVVAGLVGIVGGNLAGKPFMSRRAIQRERLKPGETLVVRYRLDQPAAVHVRISGPNAANGFWADGRSDEEKQPGLVPRGEHALLQDRRPMLVRTELYGSPTRVTLVASPKAFSKEQLNAMVRLGVDAAALAERCPRCAVDVLEVLPPSAPGEKEAPQGL